MSTKIIINSLLFFTFLFAAQAHPLLQTNKLPVKNIIVPKKVPTLHSLSTVRITMDSNGQAIHFSSNNILEGVNITVKQQGEKVVAQQSNVTINKNYSISFSPQKGVSKYTVILQQDNQIVVKRLNVE